MSGSSEGDWLVAVQSEGLAYTTISLLLSLILLYTILVASRYGNLIQGGPSAQIVGSVDIHLWIPPSMWVDTLADVDDLLYAGRCNLSNLSQHQPNNLSRWIT